MTKSNKLGMRWGTTANLELQLGCMKESLLWDITASGGYDYKKQNPIYVIAEHPVCTLETHNELWRNHV